jgi:hypothetical protein
LAAVLGQNQSWPGQLETGVGGGNQEMVGHYSQIVAKLPDRNECYEVEVGCKRYQVEVALLENTERYIHVAVSVDDGSPPPLSSPWDPASFVTRTRLTAATKIAHLIVAYCSNRWPFSHAIRPNPGSCLQ